MKKAIVWLFTIALALSFCVQSVAAAPVSAPKADKDKPSKSDDLKHPLGDKQRALRAKGLEQVLKGKATPKGKNRVVQVAKGQYVELGLEKTDRVFVVLAEFGDQVSSNYPGAAGPLHNTIPQPDRSVDNTTIWQPDYNRSHYDNLYFSGASGANSMVNYYKEQSSGRYTIQGSVYDWVKVPYNTSYYGSNYCGGITCARTWLLIRDAVNVWTQNQLASGKTLEQVKTELGTFDKWDRYDYDGDGNFDEPDGYIDHFQIVHAGEGEETGGGSYGTDAIWSHRWYAFYTGQGSTGPSFNKLGGTQIGNTGTWVGDYTIQPENGGLGVFAHEYGHDLGLPDLYDTSGNTGGAENSTAFWTLYSSGSYGSDGKPENGIGTKPTHMSAYEKIFLGWSNYQVVNAGDKASVKVGPAEYNTKQAQQLVVNLPDNKVETKLTDPFAGSKFYYSGSGDNLDNFMYKAVSLPANATLTAKVWYDIEPDWDYAYVVVSTDGGATWTGVPTNLSSNTNPNGQNFGNGITNNSAGKWVDLTANLSAYTGNVLVGFRYWTDGAATNPGFAVDEISIAGSAADGAEADAGWTFVGFGVSTGTQTNSYFNAYFAEFRQYKGYDESLQTGPYNFGFANTRPDWVEHFPYQDGLLVWYYNSQYSDNNVGDHPGAGLVLPVDAHPQLVKWADGTLLRPRLLSYDSTFGLEPTDAVTFHRNTTETVTVGPLPAVSTFNDLNTYWFGGEAPGRIQPGWFSVRVPKTGTTIEVKSVGAQNSFMQVEVRAGK